MTDLGPPLRTGFRAPVASAAVPYAVPDTALNLARRVRRRQRLLQRRAFRSPTTPVSRVWGFDRGTPVDRHYIEHFLGRQAGAEVYVTGDIHGRVLEVADDTYARRFGRATSPTGVGHVERIDVLDISTRNPKATIVGDVTDPATLPEAAFDCVICTQTLMLIYDVHAVVANLHRALKPGGVLLVTVAGIAGSIRPDVDHHGDHWRFTSSSLRRLLEERFPPEAVRVEAYGNVRTATAFLYGLAAEELSTHELDLRDPDYEVIVAARAVKPAGTA